MWTGKKDVVSGIFLLVLSCAIYLSARQIPTRLRIGVDSGFLPEIVSAALGVLAVIIIWQGMRSSSAAETPQDGEVQSAVPVVQSLILIVAYGFAITIVGFIPATIVFLIAQFFILAPRDERRPASFVVVAVIAAVTSFAIFTYGFGVILPSTNLWQGL